MGRSLAPGGRGWGGGTHGTLTRDLKEAGSRAHVVRDAALVAAAAVAGDGVEAQFGVVGGLGGDGDNGWRRQELPFEAPDGRGDTLGAAPQQRAAQQHGPAQRLAHILGAGLHLRRDWGRGRRSAGLGGVGGAAPSEATHSTLLPQPPAWRDLRADTHS